MNEKENQQEIKEEGKTVGTIKYIFSLLLHNQGLLLQHAGKYRGENHKTQGLKHQNAMEMCFCRFGKNRICQYKRKKQQFRSNRWNYDAFCLSTHSPSNYSSPSLSLSASHRKSRARRRRRCQRSAQPGRLEESKEEEEEKEKGRRLRRTLDQSGAFAHISDNISMLMCWKKTKIKTKSSGFYGNSETQSFSCTTTDSSYN